LLCAEALNCVVDARVLSAQETSARLAAQRQPSIFHARRSENRAKLEFSAFGGPASSPQKTVLPAEQVSGISDLKLVGTLPSVGAWVESGKNVTLALTGGTVGGYTLERVEPDHAVFTRENERHQIYLVYKSPEGENPPPPTAARSVPAPPREQAAPPAAGTGGIVPAGAGGEGVIAREVLNELLMNPLAEVGKMRLIPSDNGMMVMGMRSDSLFNKLGMKPKDVITSVNGIAISDVGNMANVISSMMSGTRLDFEIERGGDTMKLGYAVK
jgi:hypothetical protein